MEIYLKVKESLHPNKMKKIGFVAIDGSELNEIVDLTINDESDESDAKRKKLNPNELLSKDLHSALANMTRVQKNYYRANRTNELYNGLPPLDGGLGALNGMILVKFKPIESYTVQELLDMSVRSAYGDLKTTTTKIDPLVRNSFEISPKNVDIMFTDVMYRRLEQLSKELSENLYSSHPVTIEFNKINIYDEGGFFNLHQDTPYDDVVGSLVVTLPAPGSGGDLNIYDKNKKVLISEKIFRSPKPMSSAKTTELSKLWTFRKNRVFEEKPSCKSSCVAFYPELLHEVTEVTEGFRLSLSFHVKTVKKDHRMKTQDWVRQMADMRFDHLFETQMTGVKRVGFILEGKYSMSDYTNNTYIKSPNDVALINLLREKYSINMVPVVLNLEESEANHCYDDEDEEYYGDDGDKREINVFLNNVAFNYYEQSVWDLANICFLPVGQSCQSNGDVGSGALSIKEIESAESTGNESREGSVNNFYYSFALIASVKTNYWLTGRKIMQDVGFHFK